jgi:hypothetical protein
MSTVRYFVRSIEIIYRVEYDRIRRTVIWVCFVALVPATPELWIQRTGIVCL